MAKQTTQNIAWKYYSPDDWGERELYNEFTWQLAEAKTYFMQQLKPRYDRYYKLFVAFNGDRAREIQKWQSNIFVPYVQAVVETLMPRILDARPDFSVQGRGEEDDARAEKVGYLMDYFWEKAGMDAKTENFVRASMIYGTGFLQAYWKVDKRELSYLSSKEDSKKLVWKKQTKTFYDAPCADWVDNYDLWYDWRNVEAVDKRFWFRRRILTMAEIEKRYPAADPRKLEMIRPGGDLNDYAQVRRDVKLTTERLSKQQSFTNTSGGGVSYPGNEQYQLDLYEVFEWWRPFDDLYSVWANNVPILKDGEMPIPYNFKEAPFIPVQFLRVPGEFEGYGLPGILENPQLMLNMIKNQRLDATTLNIHKMWVVNPLANIDKKELVTRPFGIIYSTDPNGVREIQFSDVKASAFQEENLLKEDMRYASGVDDFSMGAGGDASSATEVRHLRESTIERVRLFVNHLGDSFATLQRYWMSMNQQFFTKEMTLRIIGSDGGVQFPLIEKDDIMGEFDYKATVLPSIAGQNEVAKKQDMDLMQVLLPFMQPGTGFIDAQKFVSKMLHDWNWNMADVANKQQPQPQMPPGGAPPGMPPGMPGAPGAAMPPPPGSPLPPGASPGMGGPPDLGPSSNGNEIPPEVMQAALSILGGGNTFQGALMPSPFSEAGAPIPLSPGTEPPTVPTVGGGTNPRGLNRGGAVNTNIPTSGNASTESALVNQSSNIQS